MRIVVVLPAPFGPRKPYTVPVGTRRSTPSTARVVAEALDEAGRLDREFSHPFHRFMSVR